MTGQMDVVAVVGQEQRLLNIAPITPTRGSHLGLYIPVACQVIVCINTDPEASLPVTL